MVNYFVGIVLMAGCEDHDLKIFGKFLQALLSIGSDVDSCLDDMVQWEFDWQDDITLGFG